jgi:hypothetical protein
MDSLQQFSSRTPRYAAVRPTKKPTTTPLLPLIPVLNVFDFATVHPDRSACHPSRSSRYKVTHQIGDLFGLAEASGAGLLRRIPRSHRQTALTVELQRHAVIPLRVRRLKQIDLQNCEC